MSKMGVRVCGAIAGISWTAGVMFALDIEHRSLLTFRGALDFAVFGTCMIVGVAAIVRAASSR